MQKKIKNVLYALILIIGSLIMGKTKVSANGIGVSPVNYYLKVAGGVKQILPYTLTNETDSDYNLGLTVKSFTVDEKGTPLLQEEAEFPYLKLLEATAASSLLLPAQSSRTVHILVDTPLGMEEKEYPIALLFRLQTSEKQEEVDKTQLEFNLGSNLVVLVGTSNADQSQLQLESVNLPKLIDSWQKEALRVKIKNQGAAGTLLGGEVILRRANGEVIKRETFYPDLILGGAVRQGRYKMAPDVQGKTVITNGWQWPEFLLGEYVLEVRLQSLHAASAAHEILWSQNFWALPYRLLGLISGGIIIIGVIKWWQQKSPGGKKRQWREKTQLMKEQKEFFADEKNELKNKDK